MNKQEFNYQKFWITLLLKLSVAVLTHIIEGTRDEHFIKKCRNELQGCLGLAKKRLAAPEPGEFV